MRKRTPTPRRRYRRPTAPVEAQTGPEDNPYASAGLAPDGLPLRVPVYEYGSRHQIGWLEYEDKRPQRL